MKGITKILFLLGVLSIFSYAKTDVVWSSCEDVMEEPFMPQDLCLEPCDVIED